LNFNAKIAKSAKNAKRAALKLGSLAPIFFLRL
jgi:hypothetical protein